MTSNTNKKMKVFIIGGLQQKWNEFIKVKSQLEREGFTVITPYFIKGTYTYDIELSKRHNLCDVCSYVYPLPNWHLYPDAQHDFNYAMHTEKTFLSRDVDLRGAYFSPDYK